MIKNIIFDYGGVILNIDPSLTLKSMADAGIKNPEELHMKFTALGLFEKLETGKITTQEFRDNIKSSVDFEVSDEQINKDWNALILDMPPERIRCVEEVGKNYRIFMLSNTNQIHYDKYRADLERTYGYKTFSELFEKAHFSHEIGHRKPSPEPYLYVLKEHNLIPEETLFIDDTIINVEAADKLGIHGLLLEEGIEITALFENGKLKFDI